MKHPVITLPTRPTTVRGWLETLPEPYRSQAIENCKWLEDECKFQFMAIRDSFTWKESPQGYEHWLSVCDRSLAGHFPYEFADEMKEGEK